MKKQQFPLLIISVVIFLISCQTNSVKHNILGVNFNVPNSFTFKNNISNFVIEKDTLKRTFTFFYNDMPIQIGVKQLDKLDSLDYEETVKQNFNSIVIQEKVTSNGLKKNECNKEFNGYQFQTETESFGIKFNKFFISPKEKFVLYY